MERFSGSVRRWGALIIVVSLGVVALFVSSSPGPSVSSLIESGAEIEHDTTESLDHDRSEYYSNQCSLDGCEGDYLPYTTDPVVKGQVESLLTYQGSSAQPTTTQSVNTLSSGTPVPGPDAVFSFTSRGRAHGVGLCMDGVKYRAMAGHSYIQMINYYYTGVQISTIDDSRVIRVKGRDGQVRSLTMKDYLYRLAEEPDDYPTEGLKVLAVAARTYALSCIKRGKHASEGFDICSSGNCCQAFNENKDLSRCPNHMAAVDATAGQIITHNGEPIIAAYCGSCGGHTDNYEDVWGGNPIPYLKGKPDPYCSQSPRYMTGKEISVSELSRKMGVGTIQMIDLSDRTPGGRVKNARIEGSSGTKTISGRDLASILGFSSTMIDYTFK